jgi:hypothetical protein
MTNKDRLPYYPVYEYLMKLPANQARQSGTMIVAEGVYKIVRQQTLQEVGERLLDIYDTSPDKEKAFSDAIEKLVDGVMPGER